MEDFGGLCCVKGCDKPVVAVGMCNKHWRRNKKYGSPILVNRTSGYYIGMTPVQRFFAQVKQGDGCWSWLSSKDKDGYGMFRGEWAGKMYSRAHRFSLAFHHNVVIPDGAVVCHSCDNPECCNPDHLRVGTHLENQRERRAKKRGMNQAPAAKLSPDMVRAIRAAEGFQRDIAAQFGITQSTVSDIKKRRSWAHID